VEPNRFAIARQFAPTQVKPKVAEGDFFAVHRIRPKLPRIRNF
jgi:hypothetical protein